MLDPQSAPVIRELSTAVERSFDAAEFNRIVNDSSVRPHVGFTELGLLDLTALVAEHRNVYLACEGGAIFFAADVEVGSGIYEVHTNFLETYRGRHAIACSRNAYRWMFTHTDCMSIVTRIPADNRPAGMAAGVVGFKHRFTRKGIWPLGEEKFVDLKFYALDYETWLDAAADDLIASGQAFHAALDVERQRLGMTEHGHADEDCHDLRAGACLEMIYGGQLEKGIILYNRWARFAGYGQIALIARSPLVIDIGDAVLQIQDHSFKVVKCRPQQ
jgi:hypothetical protein